MCWFFVFYKVYKYKKNYKLKNNKYNRQKNKDSF
jgi:hypothetical protein